MQHNSLGKDTAPLQTAGSNVDFAFPLTAQNSVSTGEYEK